MTDVASFCCDLNANHEHDNNLCSVPPSLVDWSGANDHERVQRQLSVSSDSKLLDDDIREETKVIMRPKKPPRPKSEVFLNKQTRSPAENGSVLLG